MRQIFTVLTILFLIGSCSQENEKANPQRELSKLIIGKGTQSRNFEVETAVKENEMRLGLMYRHNLPENQGMIFVLTSPRQISMWMKNTYIPLDMVFVDSENKISGIVERTTPLSEKFIHSPKDTKAIIELKSGTIKKHHLHKGEVVQHHLLNNL